MITATLGLGLRNKDVGSEHNRLFTGNGDPWLDLQYVPIKSDIIMTCISMLSHMYVLCTEYVRLVHITR